MTGIAPSTDDLAGQFVITQQAVYVPDGWRVRRAGEWRVATHPSLPVTEVRSGSDAFLGWALGHVITPDAELSPPTLTLGAGPGEADALEAAVFELGGRFLVLLPGARSPRLYLDPCGSLAAVYSERRPVIAATPTLIGGEDHPWDHALMEALGMPKGYGWYPSGLTPRTGVRRLLPNHYLELSSWTEHRHWPKRPERRTEDPETAVARIVRVMRRHMTATARRYEVSLPLTAGRDSRMILACSREHAERLHCFTMGDRRTTMDVVVATRLTRALGLSHEFIATVPSTAADRAAWRYRTGHCVTDRIRDLYTTLGALDPGRALVPGLAGGAGRTFYWREGDSPTTRLDADELLSRFGLPRHPASRAATAAWLEGTGVEDAFRVLDLAYLEQRFGCWGGPQQYGSDSYASCHFYPFTHRDVYASMLRLPLEYRRRRGTATDVCRRTWPELLRLPFNEPVGVYRQYARLRRIARRVLSRAAAARRALLPGG